MNSYKSLPLIIVLITVSISCWGMITLQEEVSDSSLQSPSELIGAKSVPLNADDCIEQVGYPSTEKFPSYICKNSYGHCLRAREDLEPGTVVERFVTIPHDKEYKAGLNEPLEHRHVTYGGKDASGKDLWRRVISNAAYCNHSCNANCVVNKKQEIVTLRTIRREEELCIAYDDPGEDNAYWLPTWNFMCLCKSENCRGFIDSYKKSDN